MAGRTTLLALGVVFGALLVLFMVAPILVSGAVSVTAEEFLAFPPQGFSWRWYVQLGTVRVWRGAVVNTLVIGAGAALLATLAGTLAAYGISRLPHAGLRSLLVLLFIAPLAVPHMTLALALYPLFAQAGLIGTRSGLILGQAVFGLPFVVLSVLSVIRPRDRQLEAAARSLGAAPAIAFFRVVLPMLLPGVAAGAVLAFMVAFDDVTLPIFLAGHDAGTLPKAMLDALTMDSDPSVMAASTLVATVGLVLFVLGSRFTTWRG
jgi:putative spermidine/putrescine transport system permease protein